jgi:hypothetical protein
MLRRLALVATVFIAAITPLASQEKAPAPSVEKSAPAAVNAGDVSSPDAILAALYDVISGPAGKARDWDRFRSLFLPGARLIPTGRRPTGETGARVLSPEDYIARTTPVFERDAFYEKEIARRTERFGNILHAFSTYEARRSPDAPPFLRGINSIQLYFDGTRWWVVTVFWQPETPEAPLPKEYLPAK